MDSSELHRFVSSLDVRWFGPNGSVEPDKPSYPYVKFSDVVKLVEDIDKYKVDQTVLLLKVGSDIIARRKCKDCLHSSNCKNLMNCTKCTISVFDIVKVLQSYEDSL